MEWEARSSADGRHSVDTKYEKEVRVDFTSTMPHGLIFQRDDQRIGGYTCVVQGLQRNGQAAQYNEKCKSSGEYGRMIVGYLCVRMIDEHDMAGKSFETVQQMLRDMSGSYSITFADVYHTSKTIVRQRTSGNIYQRTSSVDSAPASPSNNKMSRGTIRIPVSPSATKPAVLRKVAAAITGKTIEKADDAPIAGTNNALPSGLVEEDEPSQHSRRHSSSSGGAPERYESVVQERNGLRASILEKERVAKEQGEQVDKLRLENSALQTEITALRKEREDSHQHAQQLNMRLAEVEHEGDTLKDRLHTIEDVQAQEQQEFEAIQAEAELLEHKIVRPKDRRYSVSCQLLELTTNSAQLALLKQLLADRDILRQQTADLEHEVAEQNMILGLQQEKVFGLETAYAAAQDKIKALQQELQEVHAAEQRRADAQARVEEMIREQGEMTADEMQECISTLTVQLESETRAKLQAISELEVTRKMEKQRKLQQDQDQHDLEAFKRELSQGIVLTKYGRLGNAHARQIYSDDACTWLSWRRSDGTVLSPRHRVKLPLKELLEVLVGAKTPVFDAHPPRVAANCFSLVFLHPCRTVDLEVETEARARTIQQGFQLLLEQAVEARMREAQVGDSPS